MRPIVVISSDRIDPLKYLTAVLAAKTPQVESSGNPNKTTKILEYKTHNVKKSKANIMTKSNNSGIVSLSISAFLPINRTFFFKTIWISFV